MGSGFLCSLGTLMEITKFSLYRKKFQFLNKHFSLDLFVQTKSIFALSLNLTIYKEFNDKYFNKNQGRFISLEAKHGYHTNLIDSR